MILIGQFMFGGESGNPWFYIGTTISLLASVWYGYIQVKEKEKTEKEKISV